MSILPSFIGLVVAFAVLFATIRVQDFVRRVDELCGDIQSVAELGVDYWLSNSEEPPQVAAMEARILGRQQLVILALSSLARCFGKSRRSQLNDALALFVDALTGGAFGDPDRVSDPDRAKLMQAKMAELVATIRDQQASALRVSGILRVLI